LAKFNVTLNYCSHLVGNAGQQHAGKSRRQLLQFWCMCWLCTFCLTLSIRLTDTMQCMRVNESDEF